MSDRAASPQEEHNPATLRRLIATSRLFRGVSAGALDTLVPSARMVRRVAGERLWRRGAEARHFHVVLRGVLELQRESTGPHCTAVLLFGPGESPGVPVALERSRYIADAVAITPVLDVLVIDSEAVLAARDEDITVCHALERALLAHVRLAHARLDVLAAGSVPRRLAALLLDLCERFGDEHDDHSVFLTLPMTRTRIASIVGARPETVMRVLSLWRRTDLVREREGGFEIPSIAALREQLSGAMLDDEVAHEDGSTRR